MERWVLRVWFTSQQMGKESEEVEDLGSVI